MDTEIVVELQLFARVRELCGNRSRVSLQVPEGSTPETCFEQLAEGFPRARALRRSLAVAVNDDYADWNQPLADGDAVSFIPPVSGG